MRIFLIALICLSTGPAWAGSLDALLRDAVRTRYPAFAAEADRLDLVYGTTAVRTADRIGRLALDPRTGRFRAIAEHKSRRLRIFGRIERIKALPVPVRHLPRGAVIAADDVEMMELSLAAVPRAAVRSTRDIVGMEVRRDLSPAAPIALASLSTPRLIKRNTLVQLVIIDGGMRIRTKGRALEDGAKGELIRVANLRSGAVLNGLVAGPDRVEMMP